MKYRIGEVSKLLNIPVETIRYYEAKGFIHPFKDSNSGYRYFDVWDINFLMEYKKYRDMEFTQNDIFMMQQKDDFEQLKQRLIDKEAEIDAKIKWYQLLKAKLKHDNGIIVNIDKCINRYEIVQSPDMYYLVNRHGFEYDKDKSSILKKWFKYYPFIENTMLISDCKINWGFSIEKSWADLVGLDINCAEFIKGQNALHTVVKSQSKGCLADNVLHDIELYTQKNKYSINGEIIGNLVLRTHEDSEFVRYMRLWIPIK